MTRRDSRWSRSPLQYWVGPDGTSPPVENDKWEKASTTATTDLAGLVVATVDTPPLVAARSTTMTVVVKTMLNGRGLTGSADLTVGSPLPDLAVVPEYETLVPDVEQRLLLRAIDAHRRPIVTSFIVEGDGLRAEVQTDKRATPNSRGSRRAKSASTATWAPAPAASLPRSWFARSIPPRCSPLTPSLSRFV